ncbi:hypothetical protein [Anaerosoma tenue]|uniref:hypothetical protein n=1 Tax=Anaerosoma tenue TaxID=2933588 RepID=UPI002260CD90|nr:hypothetical protein [Anaerosoma tenue]MCK8113964.1 hypothetical protein [Anaerosoma tenue]
MGTSDALWSALDCRSPRERVFLAEAGLVALLEQAKSDDARAAALKLARRVLDAFRGNAPLPSRVVDTQDLGDVDPQWRLLHDLERARGDYESEFAPEPTFVVEHEPAHGIWLHFAGVIPPHGWVTIRFDDRLSLQAMYSKLQKAWPRLRAATDIKTRRSLGDRKLALVRFVCLEAAPGSTWRERTEVWNARYPEWSYRDALKLQNAFQKAAKTLTGDEKGLRWYYDLRFRESWRPWFLDQLRDLSDSLSWLTESDVDRLRNYLDHKGGETNGQESER